MRRITLAALVAALALLVPASAGAVDDVCTFNVGTSTWSAIGTVGGVGTSCSGSEGDTDAFVVPFGAVVDITGDITFSATEADVYLLVESGGILNLDVSDNSNDPLTLTLGEGDVGTTEALTVEAGGTFSLAGAFVETPRGEAAPGYEQGEPTEASLWRAPFVVHCDESAQTTVSQDCSTDSEKILLRWELGPHYASLSNSFVYSDWTDGVPNVQIGDLVCPLAPSLATGMCYDVTEVNGGSYPAEIELRSVFSIQDNDYADGPPHSYRDVAEITTAAAYSRGAQCITVANGLIDDTNHYGGRALHLDGYADRTAMRISHTRTETDCDNASTGAGGADAIWLLDPSGLHSGLGSGDTVRIAYGFQPGDSFRIVRPASIYDGTSASSVDIMMEAGSTWSWAAGVISGLAQIQMASAPVQNFWMTHYDLGGPGNGNQVEVQWAGSGSVLFNRTFGHGDGGNSHPWTFDNAASNVSISDSSCIFSGDDCYGWLANNTTGLSYTFTRVLCAFAALDRASTSCIDDSNSGVSIGKITATDIVSLDGNGPAHAFVLSNATASKSVLTRTIVMGVRNGSCARGESTLMHEFSNHWCVGVRQEGGSITTPFQEAFVNHFRADKLHVNTVAADNSISSLSIFHNGVISDFVNDAGPLQNYSRTEGELDNVLILDTTVGGNQRLINLPSCTFAPDCKAVVRNITVATSPGFITNVETPYNISGTTGWDTTPELVLENSIFGPWESTRSANLTVLLVTTGEPALYTPMMTGLFFWNLRQQPSGNSRPFPGSSKSEFTGTYYDYAPPDLDENFIVKSGGFAHSLGIGAGAVGRVGLTSYGWAHEINGLTPQDIGISGGGGGGGQDAW